MANIVGIDPPQNGDGIDGSYVTKISDSLNAIKNHSHDNSSTGLPVKRLSASVGDNVTIEVVSGAAQVKDASIDNTHTTFGQGLPVGAMVEYVGTSAPTGWLMCDGTAVDRTTYSALFAVMGSAFGPGDGSSTFNLPEMRGLFARGRDAGKGLDPDSASRTNRGVSGANTGDAVGSYQVNAMATHNHGMSGYSNKYCAGPGAPATDVEGGSDYSTSSSKNQLFNYSGSNTQTNPKNVYFNYIVKY